MTAPYDDLFISFQTALAGRYSLERELGRGGMGIVYLAREVRLDRPVALKLFPPALAAQPNLRERFLREARTAARLSHPHIVQIYTVDEVGQFVFFAMAYIDGETLGARVQRRGPMAPSEAARALREVAWALGHAHEQGVIHRDVKPDNILLEAATVRAMVADFGIAGSKQEAGSQTTGEVIGTPEFMSPEQAGGEQVGAQSDLYSLGVVAFYALSGRVPFTGAKSADILAKHMTQPAPPIIEQAPSTPRRVARIVDACLAKDPAERPAGAALLAEQLALAIEHRKNLPVALRAFVKHDGRIDGPGVILVTPLLAAAAVAAGSVFDAVGALTTFYGGAAFITAVVLTARARKLLKSGFEHGDLAVAYKAEIERGKEERAFSAGFCPSTLERVTKLGGFVGIGGGALTLAIAAWLGLVEPDWTVLTAAAWLGMAAGMTSTIVHLAQLQRRRDVDTEFWGKLWTGRIGRFLIRVARALLPKHAIPSAMTHRPTELAIAMAAEQLFADLPKATRKQLGDLPNVVNRLEADAQKMRARLEELQELAGDSAELRGLRDTVQKRLTDTVTALETVRLGLLRLRSGVGSIESMTTGLVAAREVGDAVERLLAGQKEVEETLRRATPV
ncbi:MAG: serine/threonine protein kinase [Gemmatimonadetes bacterium]|nr:serine/threonine protein kinase [Gemmatimonadota bacterium]